MNEDEHVPLVVPHHMYLVSDGGTFSIVDREEAILLSLSGWRVHNFKFKEGVEDD